MATPRLFALIAAVLASAVIAHSPAATQTPPVWGYYTAPGYGTYLSPGGAWIARMYGDGHTAVLTATIGTTAVCDQANGYLIGVGLRKIHIRYYTEGATPYDYANPSSFTDGTLTWEGSADTLSLFWLSRPACDSTAGGADVQLVAASSDEPGIPFGFGGRVYLTEKPCVQHPNCPNPIPSGYRNAIHGLNGSPVEPESIEVVLPTSPMQTTFTSGSESLENDGAWDYIAIRALQVIEARQDPALYPQAINVVITIQPFAGLCPATSLRLVPRSGTGRVFNLIPTSSNSYSAYFRMDNFTAPGLYDVVADCTFGGTQRMWASLEYRGYVGYQSAGSVINSVTGNVLRGARVSLWRWTGVGETYDWFDSVVAGDGTYGFDAPPGQYKALVQTDLAGEQWRGPFIVNSPIPYQDVSLVPLVDDTQPPTLNVSLLAPDTLEVIAVDDGAGLMVLEVVPNSLDSVEVIIPPFAAGKDTVRARVFLSEGAVAGSVQLRAVDRLGNTSEQTASFNLTAAAPQIAAGQAWLALPVPNPSGHRARIDFVLPARSPVLLRAYDARGGLVRVLATGTFEPGGHSVQWDGQDDAGRAIPSGVYWVKLEVGERAFTRKLALVR